LVEEFEKTKAYLWFFKNSYKFGFILRYPRGKEEITGYIFEPWHLRYVGKELAYKLYTEEITLEEYYQK
jgi:D-alanyl-D-alanine carboxypeptidase